jgi:hypothetical protein
MKRHKIKILLVCFSQEETRFVALAEQRAWINAKAL